MKTPPDRAGIIFEVGAQLEARERHKKWYSATIKKIDCDRERVLVHYQHWSHRHDEWFQWNSPLLRPLERVSLRRQGLSPPHSPVVFAAGMKVLACWTDCRFYPAKILSVNRDNSYKVRFYDGVVRTVKPTKVKPFQENSRAEKTAVGSEDWEDGGSEEESAEEKQKEGEDKKDVEEKVTADEREGGENEEEEEEKKRKAERPSCHSPAKKQADGSTSSGVQNELLTGDPPLLVPPKLPHIDRDVLLERQAHLPTTHKFSREPLYRVIKNQPPPILSIELDHNPFKCPAAGCSKSFRKASLLHYHIKYYHSEQQVDACVGEEPPRRRRSSSKRDDFVPGLKSGDQIQTCHHDDRDPGPLETGELQQDAGGEKTGQDRKDRRNFLRVKLKKKKKLKKRKKKKRKSQPGLCSSDDEISDKPAVPLKPCEPPNTPSQVDDGSDWSTLTAESGEDTPPWPVGMETEECELVRCVCEVDEENDFMIQCESCLCWQHGTCMGLYEDNVPQNYICYYCRHFAGWRRAQHFLSEPDLLISGQMFGLSCVKENYSQINSSKISHTSHLLGHVQVLTQVLSGLKLQMAMLHSPSHPELKLWRLPWKREEGVLCYVSSEHCYQKPGASWETPDEARQWKAAVKEEQEVKRDRTAADVCREVLTRSAGRAETQTRGCEDAAAQAPTLEPRTASVAECQLNLLEHVEALHHQISSRMDLIERELDVLESWLDHSGELEPPDPLSRLPQLKQRIRWLLHDLCTVRRLSFWR
ncbi:PHD finger protein 20-like [Takifugu rubripes]|uniref:PHD finger protein 20-like n=1 Tax=Takifugu rubripes TaxID=31033 RepID=UPI001145BEA5|nr:PHD finger protein 20-like [Takifugu rubripes]